MREYANDIVFCPTNKMKADPLTKVGCAVPQRRLASHTVEDEDLDACDSSWFVDDDDDDEDDLNYTCALCFSVYLEF